MITVTLPWPASCLSPNARGHWSKKAAAAAKARRDAAILCQMQGARALPWAAMSVALEFRAPTRRAYDLDNALSSCKSLLDGIADASGIDDSRWDYSIKRGEPVKDGAVIVTLTPGENSDTWQPIGCVAARLVNETARGVAARSGRTIPQPLTKG